MGLVAALRNAIQFVAFDLGRQDGAKAQAVVLIDPATGLAVSPGSVTLTGPVTVSNAVEITNDAGNAIPVSGSAAVGSAPTAPPLSVSGVDGSGNKQHLKTDTGGNVGVYSAASRTHATLTIPNGTSVSAAMDLNATALVGFFGPAAWTAAALQIQASADGATNWGTITDSAAAAVSSWSAVTALYPVSVDMGAMLPFRYIRLLSGTVALPVNQGADRVFTMITRPLA